MDRIRRSLLAGVAGTYVSPLVACAAKTPPAAPRLMPVGNRNGMFWTPFSGPAFEECQSRLKHVNGGVGVSDLRLRFVGWGLDSQTNTSSEIVLPNDLEVWASIEYPEGVFHRATFLGADKGVVRAGETLDTDIMALTLPAGATFFVRCLVRAGPGGRYPFGAICKAGMDAHESGPTGALITKVTEGEIGIGGHYSVYTASAILGVPERPAHGAVIFGDSITYGFDSGLSEDSLKGGDSAGRHGYLERALGGLGINSINLSAPGLTAFMPAANEAILARRLAFVSDLGDVMINTLGRNDWGTYWKNDVELAAAQSKLVSLFAAAGLTSVLATSLPWTDPENTKFAGDPQTQLLWRDRYNAALRAGAQSRPILDVAAAADSNGLWRDRMWESDGTHPNIVGHIALARAITPDLKALMDRLPVPAR